jgi:hypothetical protein
VVEIVMVDVVLVVVVVVVVVARGAGAAAYPLVKTGGTMEYGWGIYL